MYETRFQIPPDEVQEVIDDMARYAYAEAERKDDVVTLKHKRRRLGDNVIDRAHSMGWHLFSA